MTEKRKPTVSKRSDVGQFLDKVARTPARMDTSRLLFAMDATASRELAWDRACHLQGRMFEATTDLGNLAVQLCYYRGFNEFHRSHWCQSADSLLQEMTGVKCLGGYTQINRVLEHALAENSKNRLKAVVFVGDAMEEDADRLCHLAGQMGVLNLPLFMFQEAQDPGVRSVFRQMASLSGGAYAPFDLNSASGLKDLLSAVAVFATGGRRALQDFNPDQRLHGLLTQIKDRE